MIARGEVIKAELSSWGTYVTVTVRAHSGKISSSFDVPVNKARSYYIGRLVQLAVELDR